jgi:hypothetical protein
MRAVGCALESDVVLAVQTGRWPNRVDEDVRQHVRTCATCADAVVVAEALAEAAAMDDEAASTELQLPGSGAVWLRAEMRARAEAARTATRPITVAQVVAFTSVAAMAGALFGATSGWFQTWIGRVWSTVASVDLGSLPAPDVAASVASHLVLVSVVAAFALAAPVAVYLVVRDE